MDDEERADIETRYFMELLRSRETLAAYRAEIASWIEAGVAGTKLINEQRQRLSTIATIARNRLTATATTDEAATLWQIIGVVEWE